MSQLLKRYRLWSESLSPGDALLFAIAMGIVLWVLMAPVRAAERISFSISEAEPQILQASADSGTKFSIHASEDTERTKAAPAISFSVHDAQSLVADAKPDCTPARTLNRVVLLHATKTITTVKVCDPTGCRFVEQVSSVVPPTSAKLLLEVKSLTDPKLTTTWKAGKTECDHFWLVDVDDPKNSKLVMSLDVKRADLPLLVKESNVEFRKKAAGMTATQLAAQWNKWFLEPVPDENVAAPLEKCVSTAGSFAGNPRWDYTGNGTLRQHLTDPLGQHHLPTAVVEQWSESQVQTWHNWHHEVLSGRRALASPAKSQKAVKQSATHSAIEDRVREIARSEMRSPPPRLVAAATGRQGHAAQKKRSTISATGSRTSASA